MADEMEEISVAPHRAAAVGQALQPLSLCSFARPKPPREA